MSDIVNEPPPARDPARQRTLILWGDTRVGKTCLLAAGMLSDINRLPMVDWEASYNAIESNLREHWTRLSRNLPVNATASDSLDIDINLHDGYVVRLRDIRGDITQQTPDEEIQQIVMESDGILAVMEWRGSQLVRQLNAIESAWPLFQNRPVGLAFTKCERYFAENAKEWDAPLHWWRGQVGDTRVERILEELAESVWPTSAYGYDENGRPACVLGEFGQTVPCGIRPRNTHEPLKKMFERLTRQPERSQNGD